MARPVLTAALEDGDDGTAGGSDNDGGDVGVFSVASSTLPAKDPVALSSLSWLLPEPTELEIAVPVAIACAVVASCASLLMPLPVVAAGLVVVVVVVVVAHCTCC